MKFKRIVYRFFSNLKYLLKVDLQKEFDNMNNFILDDLFDEIALEIKGLNLNILDVQTTINYIIEKKVSVVRFGDGEINLIAGKSIPFQEANEVLSERMKNVLCCKNSNFLVCIPKFIYDEKSNLEEVGKLFWRKYGKKFREAVNPLISNECVYGAAEFTIAFNAYKKFDVELYFLSLRKIWEQREIHIICGKTVFDKIQFNIFDNAASIEFQYAPSINAFSSYEDILNTAKQTDIEKLILLILGPTAKVLAYDLFIAGYQVIDVGHIAKSYDWYMKGLNLRKQEDAVNFFKPD